MSPQEGKQSALGPDALSRKMFLRTAHGAGRGAGRRAAAHALIRPLTSTPPNLSWLSIRREQVALVSKAKDADDARVVVLALTEPGWKALERATANVGRRTGAPR